jgi:hypothetical protein
MVKSCFIVLITLMIAFQSVASIAYEAQLHHADTTHFAGHSHERAEFKSEHPTTKPSPDNPSQSSDHCHHGHSCFHMVLLGTHTDISGLLTVTVLTDYQANFTTGVQSPLFRPPIA